MKKFIIIGVIIATSIVVLGGIWYFLSASSTPQPTTISPTGSLGSGDNRPITTNPSTTGGDGQITPVDQQSGTKKIFKIADGPIAGATFIQTLRPTTTLARFVKADNGHLQDLALDSSGAIPKAVSNTTIPGVVKTLWEEGGNAVLMQYIDDGVIKTAYVGVPATSPTASSSLSKAVRLQFLPDGIRDIATSPDGNALAYILKSTSGTDGYTAKSDGTGSTKLFSLPLSQILLSWPAPTTLLAQTTSVVGVSGMLFSVGVQTGSVVPIMSASGLTALADKTFSHIVYQTVVGKRASYVRDVTKGSDIPLSFNPIPEKCTWSRADSVTLYCAVPLQNVAANYLDLWHQGAASAADSIVSFNVLSGRSTILATPGGNDGGVNSDIVELAASPDGHYLLFIPKGERSLWGLKLY